MYLIPDHLSQRSLIDFAVVSSNLWPYVMDIRVKTGAELSTDHQLDKMVGEPAGQTREIRIARVNWERLAEDPVQYIFNSHLRRSFSLLLGEGWGHGLQEDPVPAAVSCGWKVAC